MAIFKSFLDKEEVDQIQNWLGDDKEGWSSKAISGPKDPSIKHCQEYKGNYLAEIQCLIFKKLDLLFPWNAYVVLPKQSSNININRYKKGNFYREHLDVNINSGLGAYHYSSTLFLSHPKDYEKGELILTRDEEDISYKLPAGDLLSYPTGTPHKVDDVTEGTRYSAVFWTESYISLKEDRDLLRELNKSEQAFRSISHGLHKTKEKDVRHTTMLLQSVKETIISKYTVSRDFNFE